MRFENPQASYLFLALIALLFLFWFSRRRKKQALEAFAQKELLPELLPPHHPGRQRRKAIFILLSLVFGILASMRPQMGFEWEEGKRKGFDILFAVDVSKSMLAGDLKPNRLEYAKQAARELVEGLKGDRVGLIVFSGEAFLVCPLTTDYNGFLQLLDNLDTETIPRGGTSISNAIQEARRSYGNDHGERVLLLLTDGEDHEGDPIPPAEAARKDRIRIYTVGIGTREGGIIPTVDKDRQKGYLKDDRGNVVRSRLNDVILEKVASSGGGSYIQGDGGSSPLNWIYKEKLSGLEKGEFEGALRKREGEWFQIPAALCLLFSILELFPGKREKGQAGGLILFLSAMFLVSCGNTALEKAHQFYEERRYEEAQKAYETILAKNPESDIWNYNLGVVLYRKGEYAAAAEHFEKALLSDDPALEARASYNSGNCKYRLAGQIERADLKRAVDLYSQSLDFYQRAMELDERDMDAQANYQWVERRLRDIEGLLQRQEGQTQEEKESQQEHGRPYPDKGILSSPGYPEGRETDSEIPEQPISPKSLPSPFAKGGIGSTKDGMKAEMSKEEAEMLLERYRLGEGSWTGIGIRKHRGGSSEVKKDW